MAGGVEAREGGGLGREKLFFFFFSFFTPRRPRHRRPRRPRFRRS